MKKKILIYLKDNKDTYISGEKLSVELGVSRTAIWKNIKKLKEEGYIIDSVSNRGYKLIESESMLNEMELDGLVKKNVFLDKGVFLEQVDSTNQYLKDNYSNSKEEVILVSDEQTKGKGRLGNPWSSDKGTGIWMSLILRPNINPSEASKITLTAAAAVAEAIEEVTEAKTGIKWPNDIVIDGKKVCGILTEMGAELGHVNYIILGIGINVSQMNFPEDIKNKATSIKLATEIEYSRLDIIDSFLKKFKVLYKDFLGNNMDSIIEINRKKSVSINRKVFLIRGDSKVEVDSLDIDINGELIVKENNKVYNVNYGEVSVRGINGYV